MPSIFKHYIIPILVFILFFNGGKHPIYVSVTEIEHNSKENTLEISCRIFTNDFETILRKSSSMKVDLIKSTDKKNMNQLVEKYISNHLNINIDGVFKQLHFVGYEQADESIESYFQVDDVKSFKKIVVQDNILYEYKSEQISIIHTIVNNKRKSLKLNNPEDKAVFEF